MPQQQVVWCEHCHKEVLVKPIPHDCSEKRAALPAIARSTPSSDQAVKTSAMIQDGKLIYVSLDRIDGERTE